MSRERITDTDFLMQLHSVCADWTIESTTYEDARWGLRVFRGEFAGSVIEVERSAAGTAYYELHGFTGWTLQ
ncbi:MAG: hypothetical protein ACO4CT_18370 [Planctomycetota bacterium]